MKKYKYLPYDDILYHQMHNNLKTSCSMKGDVYGTTLSAPNDICGIDELNKDITALKQFFPNLHTIHRTYTYPKSVSPEPCQVIKVRLYLPK